MIQITLTFDEDGSLEAEVLNPDGKREKDAYDLLERLGQVTVRRTKPAERHVTVDERKTVRQGR